MESTLNLQRCILHTDETGSANFVGWRSCVRLAYVTVNGGFLHVGMVCFGLVFKTVPCWRGFAFSPAAERIALYIIKQSYYLASRQIGVAVVVGGR